MTDHKSRFPGPLILDTDAAKNWATFLQEFRIFLEATEKSNKPDKVKISLLLNAAGRDAIELYNTFDFANVEEKSDFEAVVEKFQQQCKTKVNITYVRYNFNKRKQLVGETMDHFITDLRKLAKDCEFGELKESLIKDRIVCGLRDKELTMRLLRQDNLDLKTAIDMAKAHEDSVANTQKMSKATNIEKIQASKVGNTKQEMYKLNVCRFCGRQHPFKKPTDCPAHGKVCYNCNKVNHFATKCKETQKREARQTIRNNIKYVNVEDNDSDTTEGSLHSYFVGALTMEINSIRSDNRTVFLKLGATYIKFKIDTGADISILPYDVYTSITDIPLRKTNIVLHSWLGPQIRPVGQINLRGVWNKIEVDITFVVVKQQFQPLLSGEDAVKLGLIQYAPNIHKTVNKIYSKKLHDPSLQEFKSLFDGKLGQIGDPVHIEIDPEVKPCVNPLRRLPYALLMPVKQKIEEMLKDGVIKQQVEPTAWVNSMVVIDKRKSKSREAKEITKEDIRLCIDPRQLNKAIKRAHYPLPSVEEIINKLQGAKVFTILDAQNGFWQMVLDESSSLLTTFNTPWGRYKFTRLPFGINCSPEIFQRTMSNLFRDMEGVEVLADDVCVWGKDLAQHDDRLQRVLRRAVTNNLKLNLNKLQLRVNKVKYLGHLITDDGIKPDPDKIKAIKEMKKPENKKDLQRFLGMVNYLGKFIPHRSQIEEPLRNLLKKECSFVWGYEQENSWNSLLEYLTNAPILKQFDPTLPVSITTDASSQGLGAELSQEGRIIAYASAALTETQKSYAQIEKELLAILFAMKKFHMFVYGRPISIFSDHKPLESICKKPLNDTPARLQRMLLSLQKYDFQIQYKKGTELFVSDTLSRAFLQETNTIEHEEVNIHYIQQVFSNELIDKVRLTMTQDEESLMLLNQVKNGWPQVKELVPKQLRHYWRFHKEIIVEDQLIYRNQSLVIPKALRRQFIQLAHEGHMGFKNTQLFAKEFMFWPTMQNEIKDLVSDCPVCIMFPKKQTKEELLPHEIPNDPWKKLGADLFYLAGKKYLIMVDYYSKFAELDQLNENAAASAVIEKCKAQFARHGIPEELCTDNGPPFVSFEFKNFLREWGIKHTTSSPLYPQSNGMIERCIQTYKRIIKKAEAAYKDPYIALLNWRNTPNIDTQSACCLLMGRSTRTRISDLKKQDTKKPDSVNLENKRRATKEYYDRTARNLTSLEEGDKVMFQKETDNNWHEAIVKTKAKEPKSYIVIPTKQPNYKQYRRNRRHLIKIKLQNREPQMAVLNDHNDNSHRVEGKHNRWWMEEEDNNMEEIENSRRPQEEEVKSRYGRVIKPPEKFIHQEF